MFSSILLTVALAGPSLALDGNGFAEKFANLPQPVQETAKAHMENAFPLSITSAQGEHGWDYQINTRLDGKHHNLVIDDKGKLVAIKDETELAALPAAAQAALKKQAAQILSLEKVTEGDRITYAAAVKGETPGTVTQIRVAADGTKR
jgi:hypothetical protein